jgi:putative nucleotidyltransferase with HDIG domain
MTTKTNVRLHKLADYTHSYLFESYQKRSEADKTHLERFLLGPEYRWQHTLRVSQFGKVIAENEVVDVELVVAACLLHDIAWFDTNADNSREHGQLGAQKSQPLLQDLGY